MTYRQAIQKLMRDIDVIYDSAGALRDAASEVEKRAFNNVRTQTRNAYQSLYQLDSNISDSKAEMELGYTI